MMLLWLLSSLCGCGVMVLMMMAVVAENDVGKDDVEMDSADKASWMVD